MRAPIEGSSVLITGASSGIGREIARQLAPRVRALALVARRKERLEELKAELLALRPELVVQVRACDLTSSEDLAAMVEEVEAELGGVDLLVNNAGFGDTSLFEHTQWEKLQRMIDLNVTALTYLSHRLLPKMYARKRGGLLNISSGFGLFFMPGFATYVGTKHFVTGFSESLRLEAKPFGVVVSQVCPGPVKTEFLDIAGNPTGEDPPAFVEISAEQCARESIHGFERGKALIVPGLLMRILYFFALRSPRWLTRFALGIVGKTFRERQEKRLAKGS